MAELSHSDSYSSNSTDDADSNWEEGNEHTLAVSDEEECNNGTEENSATHIELTGEDQHPTRALYQYILRDKPNMLRTLAQFRGERVPALEYYSVRRQDKVPRPAREFRKRSLNTIWDQSG